MKVHDLPLITYKEHFFRKGDKVRVMWNRELKSLGFEPYFNEDGDLMDGTLKNIIMVADEVEYIGDCSLFVDIVDDRFFSFFIIII